RQPLPLRALLADRRLLRLPALRDPPLPGTAVRAAARPGRPARGHRPRHPRRAHRLRRAGRVHRHGRRPGARRPGTRRNALRRHPLAHQQRHPGPRTAQPLASRPRRHGRRRAEPGTGRAHRPRHRPRAAGRLDRGRPRRPRPPRRHGRRPRAATAHGHPPGRPHGPRSGDMSAGTGDAQAPDSGRARDDGTGDRQDTGHHDGPDPSGAAGTRGAGPDGTEPEEDLLARVLLTRVFEPGDATGGQWVRERGAPAVARRLRSGGPPLPGVSGRRWAGLLARAERARPRQDLAVARDAGVRFVRPGAAEWPRQLDDLGDARPLGLWVRGPAGLRMWALRSVAVVGARACTEYGAHMAATLSAGLAESGWIVVSGGAYGVDGAAHRGALASGGATVAVLACGVDRPYPRGHTQLIGRIAEQGLVIGELPPGEHPTQSRFVLRNRVIAALTRGTVVVEAAHRSGSLVTARAA